MLPPLPSRHFDKSETTCVTDVLPEIVRVGPELLIDCTQPLEQAGARCIDDLLVSRVTDSQLESLASAYSALAANELRAAPLSMLLPSLVDGRERAVLAPGDLPVGAPRQLSETFVLAGESYSSLASLPSLGDAGACRLIAAVVRSVLFEERAAVSTRGKALLPPEPPEPAPEHARDDAARLLHGLTERETAVLLERALTLADAATLLELGERFGCTRERIRQVEATTLRTLRKRVDREASAAFREMAVAIRRRLGVASSTDRASKLCPELGALDGVVDTEVLLLLWQAGPYQLVDGWLMSGSEMLLRKLTKKVLAKSCKCGPAQLESVIGELTKHEIRSDAVAAWIERCGGYRTSGDRVVGWPASATDKAVALLQLAGRPLDASEILAGLPREYNRRAIISRLIEDRRFIRLQLRQFGLRSWGGEEYVSVTHAIKSELKRRGGRASLVDLEIVISEKFGVARSSVSAYANGPMFELSDGIVTQPSRPQVPKSRKSPGDVKACFKIGERWAFRLQVSKEDLRGSGRFLPKAFAMLLGARPRREIKLATRYGRMRVAWPSIQPQMGSIRQIAGHLKLEEGDFLFLFNARPGGLRLVPLRAQELEGRSSTERMALLCGISSKYLQRKDLLRRIALRLGGDGKGAPLFQIRSRLDARHEKDLLALMRPE